MKVIQHFVILCLFPIQTLVSSDTVEKIGDVLQVLIPSAAYGTTLYLDDKEGQMQFYKSFATTMGTSYALKYTIDETRPNGGDHSFPSGHTSAAFQGAAFIHRRYGIKYGIPAYVAAAFVGYSRVASKNHWTKDVLVGAAIGVVSSFYFTTQYKGFTITPEIKRDQYGIKISKQW